MTAASPSCATALPPQLPRDHQIWEARADFMRAVEYSIPEPDFLGVAVKRHPLSISIKHLIC